MLEVPYVGQMAETGPTLDWASIREIFGTFVACDLL